MCRRNQKRSNFDLKPKGLPEGMLDTGTLGAMMKVYSSAPGSSNSSKLIIRLLVTNLPSEYQEIVCSEIGVG